MLILAQNDIFSHLSDHPWPGMQVRVGPLTLTVMSSGIATMLLVALALAVVVPLLARRRQDKPHGAYNLLEALVVFVRDIIARPALGDRADRFVPLLATMFVFILSLNLFGLVPLAQLSHILGAGGYQVGGPTTSIPAVTAGLAMVSLLVIIASGLWGGARRQHLARGWPMGLCLALSPLLWLVNLAPRIPGFIGVVLAPVLAVLEMTGAVMKCFALMIRLFANMLSGHALVAVLGLLALQAAEVGLRRNLVLLPVSLLPILGGVLLNLLDVLVAGLQAYIFTFLTAMYLGLYGGGGHEPQQSPAPV